MTSPWLMWTLLSIQGTGKERSLLKTILRLVYRPRRRLHYDFFIYFTIQVLGSLWSLLFPWSHYTASLEFFHQCRQGEFDTPLPNPRLITFTFKLQYCSISVLDV